MPKKFNVEVFTEQDLASLKEAERKIADVLPILDKAERCGVDCDVYRTIAAELSKRLQAIEREFMNPVPNN